MHDVRPVFVHRTRYRPRHFAARPPAGRRQNPHASRRQLVPALRSHVANAGHPHASPLQLGHQRAFAAVGPAGEKEHAPAAAVPAGDRIGGEQDPLRVGRHASLSPRSSARSFAYLRNT